MSLCNKKALSEDRALIRLRRINIKKQLSLAAPDRKASEHTSRVNSKKKA